MKKVYVSWSDVQRQVQEIIRQMYLAEFKPDYIVGITRGGLAPANLISQYLDIPMHALKVSLRSDSETESNLWMATDAFAGKKILIVDDINDSGATINWIRQDWQSSCDPNSTTWADIWNTTVRIAVLYDNESSDNEIAVDYAAEHVNKFEDPQWIVFPWEEWWRRWNPEEQHQ
jgi:hypoxanthine phosphoribosyltransferase